tara:strand:- start:621 stop:1253 length:633 start_codon:yes stop_codon:yes gene_type:complete
MIFNDVWSDYINVLRDRLGLLDGESSNWARWTGKNIELEATIHTPKYCLKSREVTIWNTKGTCIYNNIIYPKTGANLPCFGVDLMMFFPKKVVLTFDFQHPKENYPFSVEGLPKCEGDIRFFEPGNHFSDNLYVRKCTMEGINDYLEDFTKYVETFADMLYCKKPEGLDTTEYTDFDQYMTKLDPVAGYLANNFGKEKSEKFVNEFLFSY